MTFQWTSRAKALASSRPAVNALFASALIASIQGLTACASISAGEVTAAACLEGNDDEDGDGKMNCEDPDCFAFEACRPSALSRDAGGAGSSPTAGTGGAGGSGSSNSGGASASGGSGGDEPQPILDGGDDSGFVIPIMPDASFVPDAAIIPCGGCAVGEVCVEDVCEPGGDPTGGTYTITVVSGTVPYATDGICVDVSCNLSPVVYCICRPDPYVRVVLVRQSEEEVVLDSNVVSRSVDPMFDVEGFPVTLEQGDTLRFEMWDKNQTIADKQVFSCKPDLSNLTPGPLECSTLSGYFDNEIHWIRATLAHARSAGPGPL